MDFPVEIWERIFRHVPDEKRNRWDRGKNITREETLKNLCLVNHYIKDVAQPILWETLYVNDDLDTLKFTSLLKHVKKFQMSITRFDESETEESELVSAALYHMPNLKHIVIEGWITNMAPDIWDAVNEMEIEKVTLFTLYYWDFVDFKNVQHVELESDPCYLDQARPDEYLNSSDVVEMLKTCKKLRSWKCTPGLKMNGHEWDPFRPTLTEISIDLQEKFETLEETDDQLEYMRDMVAGLQHDYPNVTKVSLINCSGMDLHYEEDEEEWDELIEDLLEAVSEFENVEELIVRGFGDQD